MQKMVINLKERIKIKGQNRINDNSNSIKNVKLRD